MPCGNTALMFWWKPEHSPTTEKTGPERLLPFEPRQCKESDRKTRTTENLGTRFECYVSHLP